MTAGTMAGVAPPAAATNLSIVAPVAPVAPGVPEVRGLGRVKAKVQGAIDHDPRSGMIAVRAGIKAAGTGQNGLRLRCPTSTWPSLPTTKVSSHWRGRSK